ncbi:hypothetical protein FC83_GL003035 [Agrilactobacillus composti DSM 18527 = JCM 14202]|uniref:HTH tetR-type domain-containing protein n=1 Tax=Agrilactobacillus composti DSM 18527 = JCM 14202 TaxID=1423734 RepID=X0QN55_9LACO|nr:TetR/AcrR family transcriptional regulator [Agrilactobacillus composti]KRM36282.1 hypothetical protein FC83_GL003035 [Agrilactobacillus composti DSM 18527 = JCM 14202]GAF40030.1 transcriptional regulator, TetR family [Agrilactobacillus composti DSM 18527 = JCM 14202]
MCAEKKETRKSGDALTQAIYQAAVAILNESGYEKVTFASVARRAKTGRTVLYRRFESPFALLYQAVQYFSDAKHESAIEDADFSQHNLRDNLLAVLQRFRVSSQFFGRNQQFLKAFLIELGKDSPQVKAIMAELRRQDLFLMDRLLSQAQLKGEIQHAVTDYVKLLPFQLILYQAMIEAKEITDDVAAEIVDTVVLPAIMAQQ